MTKAQPFELLLNDERSDHTSKIFELFKNAKRFECMVAFAKVSGWKYAKTPLEEALSNGMTSRIAVGLDFYHTDPALLRSLFRLTTKHNLDLYLSNSDRTFHPKIYAFEHDDGAKVILGSANLTQGGLSKNYEASVLIDDRRGALMASVTAHFDDLIEAREIIPATIDLIDRYEKEYEINSAWSRLAKRRASRPVEFVDPSLTMLAHYLRMMQEGGSESDFEIQLKIRRDNLAVALAQLRSIAVWRGKTAREFLSEYEKLIGLFHSGGLDRSKTRIADQRREYVRAVASIIDSSNLSPRDAFAVLHSAFANIRGAGINLLTEMLHALDNKRFAVMNQNSVAGLRLAGYSDFPKHPLKSNVSADKYQHYCDQMDAVRKALGLRDFTELDALFNFIYWHEDRQDKDEENDDEI